MAIALEQDLHTKWLHKGWDGSKSVAASLVEHGVDTVFGVPGASVLPIYDAIGDLIKAEMMRHITTTHEQIAAHAADGLARVTRRPGVVLASSGPGAINLLTGLYTAYVDSVPVVAIVGQVPRDRLGTEAFQEVDIEAMAKPVTKWCYQATNAMELCGKLDYGFYQATTGRPGPVLISIPLDVQTERVRYSNDNLRLQESRLSNQPLIEQTDAMDLAINWLNYNQKRIIVAGHGVRIAGAERKLLEVAEKGEIRVATTLLGKSAFPEDHPLFAGMVGSCGTFEANDLLKEADVALLIGTRQAQRSLGESYFGSRTRVIDINIAPRLRRNKTTLSINADAGIALQYIANRLKARNTDWINWTPVIDRTDAEPDTRNLTALGLADTIDRQTNGEAFIVADAGTAPITLAMRYRSTHINSFFIAGGAGTMGFAVPAAIGVAIGAETEGRGNIPTIAFAGDGGISMTLSALATIAQEKLPVKVFVADNAGFQMVRNIQIRNKLNCIGVDLKSPLFGQIAASYDIRGEGIEDLDDLKGAVRRTLSAPGPALLHTRIYAA